MSSFRSLGVGSGLDLETLVSGLVRAERQPKEALLNRARTATQTRLSALGTLRSAVAGLATSVKAFADLRVGFTATSSDAARVAASAGPGATAGSFQLRVTQLATAQSLASAAFADAQAPLGAGELTISVGGESRSLTFAGASPSLDEVRDAINASDLGVQAVVVRDGDQSRLLLTSGRTGTAGEMTLSVSGGLDGRLASTAMEVTASASDAAFTVNGLALTSASNTIEDVVPGVTLTLRGLTEGADAVTVTVAVDRQGLRGRIDALVRTFNALVDNMRSAGRADPEGGNSGPLVGDATLRSIQARVSGSFSARIDTGAGGGPFTTLLDIGLSTDLDGRARLDADRLAAALQQDQTGAESLLSAFAASFGAALDGFTGPGGVLDSRQTSLNADLRRNSQAREALDRRMEQVEARLRAQFQALDSLVAQFQNTSVYLNQQLANLSNLTLDRNR